MAKKRNRRRQEIPKDESKADRFVRVVTPRVGKAIKAIRQIGFCAGGTYEYTPEQAQQIVEALAKETKALSTKFETKADTQAAFEFA